MASKIESAVKACDSFVRDFHRSEDRGCIATFSNHYRVVQNFTSSEPLMLRSLSDIDNSSCDGMTRLYDSIVDMINYFRNNGDRSRPWLLFVVTDGEDNSSTRSANSTGRTVMQTYNGESSNFIFVIGVGSEVNQSKMKEMSDAGGFNYVHIDSMEELKRLLVLIMVQVTQQIVGVSVETDAFSAMMLQRQRGLANRFIDYAFLIDVSGSMTEKANIYKCFANHTMSETDEGKQWQCNICDAHRRGSAGYKCSTCNLFACQSHIDGNKLEPKGTCGNDHPLVYKHMSSWNCDECSRSFRNCRSLGCRRCNYDTCNSCFEDRGVSSAAAAMFLLALLGKSSTTQRF